MERGAGHAVEKEGVKVMRDGLLTHHFQLLARFSLDYFVRDIRTSNPVPSRESKSNLP